MVKGRTIVATPFLAGRTLRVRFQIVDEDGIGFRPDTLAMSIYDVTTGSPFVYDTIYRLSGSVTGPLVTSASVNGEDDVDVSSFIDANGNVILYLTPEDTDIPVPAVIVAQHHQRRILFKWTWESPTKTGKHEILFKLVPDRETVAA